MITKLPIQSSTMYLTKFFRQKKTAKIFQARMALTLKEILEL